MAEILRAMDLASWIDVAVAGGTLALAGVTFFMAKATRDMATATREMAEGAQAELELLRRSAVALEATSEQGQRRLEDESFPSLSVCRMEGDYAWAILDSEGTFSIQLRNEGPVRADIADAKLNLPQPVWLRPRGARSMKPEDEMWLVSERLVAAEEFEGNVRLVVNFRGPKRLPQNMQAGLKYRGGDDRFLVAESEVHKAG